MNKAPYIIIGMHRSGTSLLAKVLEKAGIFMGVMKDHNFEAIHFLSLNQTLLSNQNADWLDPKQIDWSSDLEYSAADLYHEHFKATGRLQKLKLKLTNNKWGWKDPRNTFTLNYWLHMYPDAKVIHIIREKDEVVASLQSRNKKTGEVHDERLDQKEFCEQLWSKYIGQAELYKSKLGNRFLEISYNQLVKKEKKTINELESFTNLEIKSNLNYYLKKKKKNA